MTTDRPAAAMAPASNTELADDSRSVSWNVRNVEARSRTRATGWQGETRRGLPGRATR